MVVAFFALIIKKAVFVPFAVTAPSGNAESLTFARLTLPPVKPVTSTHRSDLADVELTLYAM